MVMRSVRASGARLMRAVGRAARRVARAMLDQVGTRELAFLVGLGSSSAGVSWIYPPAGLIWGGLVLLAVSLGWAARRPGRAGKE